MKMDLQSSLSSCERTDKETHKTLARSLSLLYTHLHPPSPSRSDTGRTLLSPRVSSPLLSHTCLCGRRSANAGVSLCIIGSSISPHLPPHRSAQATSCSWGSHSDHQRRPPICIVDVDAAPCAAYLDIMCVLQERWTLY